MMADKTPREELDDAIAILRSDGLHIRKHIESILDARGIKAADPIEKPPQPPAEPGEGDPPPPKDPPPDPAAKKDWWFR